MDKPTKLAFIGAFVLFLIGFVLAGYTSAAEAGRIVTPPLVLTKKEHAYAVLGAAKISREALLELRLPVAANQQRRPCFLVKELKTGFDYEGYPISVWEANCEDFGPAFLLVKEYGVSA